MTDEQTVDEAADGTTPVEWRRLSPTDVAPPVVERLPYLEVKLEHPDLEPTAFGDQFVPDAVPYELDGTDRVFFWRPALTTSGAFENPRLACATTHGLAVIEDLPSTVPPLVTCESNGVSIVVDGTIVGDGTVARVASYDPPTVRVEGVSDSAVTLSVVGETHVVAAGDRRRIALPDRGVTVLGDDETSATITPELVVRYPGRRELYHPAPDTADRLFPSFGLDLSELPNPVPVSTTVGELNENRLATQLDVPLGARPYAERVLWEAFAYTAFDPHTDTVPAIAQLPTGHVVLRTDR